MPLPDVNAILPALRVPAPTAIVFIPDVFVRGMVMIPVTFKVTPELNSDRVCVPVFVLKVIEPTLIFDFIFAVPPVLLKLKAPVVINPSISCVASVPVIVTAELPAVKVPALTKFPWKVRARLLVARVAAEFIFKGTLLLFPNVLASFMVIVPVLLMITPPVSVEVIDAGHSTPAVLPVAVLYCKIAFVP